GGVGGGCRGGGRLAAAGVARLCRAGLIAGGSGPFEGPELNRAVGSFRAEGFQACSPEADRTNAPPAPAEEIRRAEPLAAPARSAGVQLPEKNNSRTPRLRRGATSCPGPPSPPGRSPVRAAGAGDRR